MARSTSFLVTEIPAVVHTRWRDCQPGDLTCQHKRPNGLRNTTNAACIRRQYSRSQVISEVRRPAQSEFLTSPHIRFLIFLGEAQPVCRSYGAKVLDNVGGCPRTGTTDRQTGRYTDKADRHGKGVFIVCPYHNCMWP